MSWYFSWLSRSMRDIGFLGMEHWRLMFSTPENPFFKCQNETSLGRNFNEIQMKKKYRTHNVYVQVTTYLKPEGFQAHFLAYYTTTFISAPLVRLIWALSPFYPRIILDLLIFFQQNKQLSVILKANLVTLITMLTNLKHLEPRADQSTARIQRQRGLGAIMRISWSTSSRCALSPCQCWLGSRWLYGQFLEFVHFHGQVQKWGNEVYIVLLGPPDRSMVQFYAVFVV